MDLPEIEARQSSKLSQLILLQEERKRTEEDIIVALKLKQGQVETEPQGMVDCQLDHAVLVALQLVQVWALHLPFRSTI